MLHFSLFLLFSPPAVTTLSTPVSEITTTLSSQSNSNAEKTTAPHISAASSSLSPDIDVTTMAIGHRTDESLKVLPLKANTTASANDKDEAATVTSSSTHSPVTVNSFGAKSEMINNGGGGSIEQLVNNGSDNLTNQPQKDLVEDEMEGKSRSNHGKEGRAINYPLDATSNNQSSTISAPMQGTINFVTTSTEKTRVMSFFDLSDVSMDHDDNDRREMESKVKTTTEKQTAEINSDCSYNGSSFKVSSKSFVCIRGLHKERESEDLSKQCSAMKTWGRLSFMSCIFWSVYESSLRHSRYKLLCKSQNPF